MDRTEFLAPFERLLESACTPAVVRAIEAGSDAAALWDAVEASGFLDALVPEAQGGAGLALADIAPILIACGRFAVPLPVGDTIAARHLFAHRGGAPPSGPIRLTSGHAEAAAVGALPAVRAQDIRVDGDAPGLHLAALVRAAAIAGAAQWLLDASLAYANDRVQFGKPIGRQQALQQQLAVMAEQSVAARIAVEIACAAGLPLPLAPAATAKIVASAAAVPIAATAHAVHGAIGISAEHDLHLYTRRLLGWRMEHGSEGWWEARLGAERLAADARSVDWVRAAITG